MNTRGKQFGKQCIATMLAAFTLSISSAHNEDSVASRIDNNIQQISLDTQRLPEGLDASRAGRMLRATPRQALEISNDTLRKYDVAALLEMSAHPSTHFVSRLYSFIQSEEMTSSRNLLAFAKNASTPTNILHSLSLHKDEAVRVAVASNPSIHLGIIRNLQQQDSRKIRFALALNPSAARIVPVEAADYIAEIVRSGAVDISSSLSAQEIRQRIQRNDFYTLSFSLHHARSNASEAAQLATAFTQQISSQS